MESMAFSNKGIDSIDFSFLEIVRVRVGAGRGRGRQGILSRLHSQRRARCGARSRNPEIMTWAKINSQILNWLGHSGTPTALIFWYEIYKPNALLVITE